MRDLARHYSPLAGIVAIFIFACDSPHSRMMSAANPDQETTRILDDVVIFSAREALADLSQLGACDGEHVRDVSGTWPPDSVTVMAVEYGLPVILDSMFKTVHDSTVRSVELRNYYRQYLGLMQRGKRIVIVNGYEKANLRADLDATQVLAERGDTVDLREDVWKHRILMACDAGTGQFIALFDPSQGRIVSLQFNDTMAGPP